MKLTDLLTTPLLVFDVESIGLHGEGYAVGWVVIRGGEEIEHGKHACDPKNAIGYESNLKWIQDNVPPLPVTQPTTEYVRHEFWEAWCRWKGEGALMAADCGWPVEANFLEACIQYDEMERQFSGPYPLLEISGFLLAAGRDPMEKFSRLKEEIPEHDPEADARQSARLLWNAIKQLAATKP